MTLEEREAAALAEIEIVLAARERPLKLGEIGTLLGFSRERVRQIEAAALHKLRRAMLEEGLADGHGDAAALAARVAADTRRRARGGASRSQTAPNPTR